MYDEVKSDRNIVTNYHDNIMLDTCQDEPGRFIKFLYFLWDWEYVWSPDIIIRENDDESKADTGNREHHTGGSGNMGHLALGIAGIRYLSACFVPFYRLVRPVAPFSQESQNAWVP